VVVVHCPQGKIISIDVDHSKLHEGAKVSGIEFYLGSSVEKETLIHIKAHIAAYKCERVMVILDSDHSYGHVSKELELYASFVTVGSILIVEDASNCPEVLEAIQSWELSQQGFKKNLMAEKYMLTFNRDGYWERLT
jgi:cephalosporin hydroxylase